jgi:hypothetical protein
MAMRGRTTCAVHGCTMPISGPNNLCDEHRLPGGVVRVGNSTMVITFWTAEHEAETGIIVLNDFALGDLFGGGAGFEAHLYEQGFTGVRNIRTPEELEFGQGAGSRQKVGAWGGPWRTQYPWQTTE